MAKERSDKRVLKNIIEFCDQQLEKAGNNPGARAVFGTIHDLAKVMMNQQRRFDGNNENHGSIDSEFADKFLAAFGEHASRVENVITQAMNNGFTGMNALIQSQHKGLIDNLSTHFQNGKKS